MPNPLLVGAAEIDITPPVGVALCGNLTPRPSIGVEDPLTFKAIVLEHAGVKIVYVLADLIALDRNVGDVLVAAAAQRTGIPASQIVWAASHTHTGPYVWRGHPAANEKWLDSLPEKFAKVVEQAHAARRPARLCFERGYSNAMVHNRRLKYKDGREINTWLLNRGEEQVQCLGSAAPIDPEVGILSFDDENGAPIAILWHYTVHTNANFGPYFSADFPGVVAGRLREKFGPQVVPIFMPGAFGDINGEVPEASADRRAYRFMGNQLANVIVSRMDQRKPRAVEPTLAAFKEEITIPFRDFTVDQEERIEKSQWPKDCGDVFRNDLKQLRAEGRTQGTTIIQAWRIGDIGFASLPGEIFVEWGLKIKAQSPFPWTFPVFMGGDCLGYLVTDQAWESGGYESLLSLYSRPTAQGVSQMTDKALAMLGQLWKK